jgi:hypothetical protein
MGDILGLRRGQGDLAKLDRAPLFRVRFGAAAADRPARGFLAQHDCGAAAQRPGGCAIDFPCERQQRAHWIQRVVERGVARGGGRGARKKGRARGLPPGGTSACGRVPSALRAPGDVAGC